MTFKKLTWWWKVWWYDCVIVVHSPSKCLVWVKKCCHLCLDQNFDPSLLTSKLWLVFMGMKQKKSKWPTQKNKIANSQYFLWKPNILTGSVTLRFLDCTIKAPNCYIPLSLNKSASFFIFEKKERDEKKIISKLFDIWQLNSVRTVMFEQSFHI